MLVKNRIKVRGFVASVGFVTARMDYLVVAPESTKGLVETQRFVRAGSLSWPLLELIKLRVSQMNGCAYCLALHAARARKAGVPLSQQDTLAAWRQSTAFSPREQAALEWAEALTFVAEGHVPDSAWELVRAQFSEREIVELSMAVVDINSYNRLEIAFRRPPEFDHSAPPSAPPPAPASSS